MAENTNKIWLFRMVHHSNVEYILRNGLYTKKSPKADPNYVSIGDKKLIGERAEYKAGINEGGNLGDYIPFYFAGHSPMLLNIKTGYRGITKLPQVEIVYIVCEANDIANKSEKWLFTDGHAKNSITKFFDDLKNTQQLDWGVIRNRFWNNTDADFDIMRRKQAEFMVQGHVPLACIKGLIVKNEAKKIEMERIILKLGLALKVYVDVNSKYYYP